ncbi:uncharacterized protein METZ01_LOCUS427543 [marine metagenome]|uniref:Uncharacterized protein n=1 Tax=marine metagenome TaxID=408172 RepID=A0A382XV32_9ZZZZ
MPGDFLVKDSQMQRLGWKNGAATLVLAMTNGIK